MMFDARCTQFIHRTQHVYNVFCVWVVGCVCLCELRVRVPDAIRTVPPYLCSHSRYVGFDLAYRYIFRAHLPFSGGS